jgi:aminoglycoside phosphotransferase
MADAVPELTAVLAALDLPRAHASARMPGYDAVVWRAELTDGRTLAVRLLRAGVPAAGELTALRLATEHGQPAPAVIAIGQYDGRDVVAMSWCRGRTIGELLGVGGDPDRLGRLFGRAHADLHRPLDSAGQVLCHLDFHPFNVLVDDGQVSGIVDWVNARIGDRRDDLAWTRVVLALAPALLPDFVAQIDRFGAAWQAGYRERRPMPDDTELAPFLAAAAHRQLEDWEPRVIAGECPTSVGNAARAITSAWPR